MIGKHAHHIIDNFLIQNPSVFLLSGPAFKHRIRHELARNEIAIPGFTAKSYQLCPEITVIAPKSRAGSKQAHAGNIGAYVNFRGDRLYLGSFPPHIAKWSSHLAREIALQEDVWGKQGRGAIGKKEFVSMLKSKKLYVGAVPRGLTDTAKAIVNEWINEHIANPIPKRRDLYVLAVHAKSEAQKVQHYLRYTRHRRMRKVEGKWEWIEAEGGEDENEIEDDDKSVAEAVVDDVDFDSDLEEFQLDDVEFEVEFESV